MAASGLGKARNITDMPPVGRIKIPDPRRDLRRVEYVVCSAIAKADPARRSAAGKLFLTRAIANDCHSPTAGQSRLWVDDFTANTLCTAALGDFVRERAQRPPRLDAALSANWKRRTDARAVALCLLRSHPPQV